jgi:uncharacterized repeat protein (TIGR03806 family)
MAYEVNSPLWSDGAEKERFIGLPGGATIDYADSGAWALPEGTVLVKTFSLEVAAEGEAGGGRRRRIETRLLHRWQGQWLGYSYLWNDEQTDGELVAAAGRDVPYLVVDAGAPGGSRTQVWHYPSRAECMMCHSRAAGFVLGLNTLQINRIVRHGGVEEGQLDYLDLRGAFTEPLATYPGVRPRLPDPADPSLPLAARARSYLHANCAHCHVADGGGNSRIVLAYTTPLDEAALVDALPQHDALSLAEARVVAAGDAERSLLYRRMTTTGAGRMPRVASSVVDHQGVALVRQWIESLGAEDGE